MSIEEKAKAYDEALTIAKQVINNNCSEIEKLCLECVLPELKESEDERIRKSIASIIDQYACICEKEGDPCEASLINDCLAYLEKQKDSGKAMSAIEKIDKYIDTHTANAHDMDDSNPDKKYYSGVDGTLSDIAGILIDVYSEGKQKSNIEKLREISTPADEDWFEIEKKWEKEDEQKPTEWNPNNEDVTLFNKAVTTNPNLTPAERAKLDIIRMKFKHCNGNTVKPAEWSEKDKKLCQKTIEWLEEKCFPYALDDNNPARDCIVWLKSLRPPLKDREMKLKILKYLSTRCSSLEFEEVEDYLNNLHPSWKPSEEQIRALNEIINTVAGSKNPHESDYLFNALNGLRKNLKKL